MSIPKRVVEKLESQSVEYKVIDTFSCCDIYQPEGQHKEACKKLIRGVGFKQDEQAYFVLLPYYYMLDYRLLTELLGFEPTVMDNDSLDKLFKACDAGSYPPIDGYGLKLIVDPSVLDMDEICMQSGDIDKLIKLDKMAGNLLFQDCESLKFAISPERFFAGRNNAKDGKEIDLSFTPIRLKQRVDETFDLPAMPDIAQDIMKLRVDPSADAAKLGQIVARDPSLAAQVISWASSPYYGYKGKIDSIEMAIARVLGFELVMNLALGISIGKSLKVPKEGPLGIKEFWKQSIYTASLAEKLCRAMPIKQRPERGLIYLSGLLHNFGHLLLGHIFPPQFKLINQSILTNPHISVEDIEFYILGVTHEEIGAWLMQNWHMPDELIVAVHRHHQEEFWSKHSVYSNIVLVANRLLKQLDIGDSVMTQIPETTLELLALDEEDVEAALEDIRTESESLDIMAKQLVA
ncbi:MAG: HDOD domain-containing protein [Enterobacterales bacterium]|nr:HDOD domain-containing protein [Enterobacterales bacterium]